MKRRRFPLWQRFPHRPLPKTWRTWAKLGCRITAAEIAFILDATRAERVMAIDRTEIPYLNFLMHPKHFHRKPLPMPIREPQRIKFANLKRYDPWAIK